MIGIQVKVRLIL